MKQKCEYCGSFINDTDDKCPNCGGVNENVMRSANGLPKTIQQLKDYAAANNLPLEQMRFFIGEDFKEPRAFGIYEENGVFTVYKNKADGSRAIRYKGTDEAYAVNELYQKMHSEIMMRKQNKASSRSASGYQQAYNAQKTWYRSPIAWIVILVFLGFIIFGLTANSAKRGYYYYDDHIYYYQGSWYEYDDGWERANPDSSFTDNADDYYQGSSYESGNGYSDFEDSGYYDSDWGNDDSWDSNDSWDSGDTDWDSDW